MAGLGVLVGKGMTVCVGEGPGVAVFEGMTVGVEVAVFVGVGVFDGVGVFVGVLLGVLVAVFVGVGVGIWIVFSKYFMSPPAAPINASRSPSPSRSAKLGAGLAPTLARPKGLSTMRANSGLIAVPVFSKYLVSPLNSPMKASRSPSPSRSMNVGLAKSPTSNRPKGLSITPAKRGVIAVPVHPPHRSRQARHLR